MKNKIILLSNIILVIGVTSLILAYTNSVSNFNVVPSQAVGVSDIPISTPEQTISEYIVFSKDNKTAEIKKLITTLPDSYIKYVFNDVSDPQSKNKKSQSSITDEDGVETFLTLEDEIKSFRKSFEPLIYNVLTQDYPDTIRTTKLGIKNIVSQKIKGNDAYFRVNLRSETKKDYSRELFFFLHKEEQAWKIFYITDFVFSDNFPN